MNLNDYKNKSKEDLLLEIIRLAAEYHTITERISFWNAISKPMALILICELRSRISEIKILIKMNEK
ncbi:hypothetical protein ACFL2K_02760 [Candidatus Margulisiibacteriota bacterium]